MKIKISTVLKRISILLLLSLGIIVVVFGYKDIPLETLKQKYSNSNSGFIKVQNIDVHYREQGLLSDTNPIILLHGTGASLHTFEAWADTLSKNHRVISIDLPAYGLTGPFQSADYSMANYIDFLNAFLDKKEIESCILMGNSFGGAIAWNYSLQFPDQISELVLIDASGYPTISQSTPVLFKLGNIALFKDIFTYITPKFLVKSSVENVYAQPTKVTTELVNRYFDMSLRPGNRAAFFDRQKAAKDSTAYLKIPQIKQRTLVLWGAKDRLIPVENAYKFHRDIPNSELVILKDLGHTPMEEDPNNSLKPVLSFLSKKAN